MPLQLYCFHKMISTRIWNFDMVREHTAACQGLKSLPSYLGWKYHYQSWHNFVLHHEFRLGCTKPIADSPKLAWTYWITSSCNLYMVIMERLGFRGFVLFDCSRADTGDLLITSNRYFLMQMFRKIFWSCCLATAIWYVLDENRSLKASELNITYFYYFIGMLTR